MHHHLCLLRMPSPSPSPSPATTNTNKTNNKTNNNNTKRIILTPPSPPSSSSISLSLSTSTSTSSSSSSPSLNRTVEYLSDTLRIDPHRALSINPSLRTHPLPSLRDSHHHLLSAGLSPTQISRVFTSNPLLLTYPFLPSLNFLSSLFPSTSLPLALSRCPRLLSSPVRSQLSPAHHFLCSLSISINPSNSLLLASHVESTLLPKLDFLLYSLPCGPLPLHLVKYILRRSPRILTYSIPNNIQPKALFLHNDMHLDVRTEITKFPQYFAFNLDNKIKRRHRLLLQNGFHMTLHDMLTTSDGDFDQRLLDRKLQLVNNIIRHRRG